jgi:hypothetical protein
VACTALALCRSFVAVQALKYDHVSPALTNWSLALYMTQTSLIFISACFLGDALRMFVKQLKKIRSLEVNQKTMCLHLTSLFLVSVIHTACMAFFQVSRVYYYKSLGTESEQTWTLIWNWGRLILYVSGVISEMVVIYIFMELAKPPSLKKEVDDGDSEYEEEFDRIRNPNTDLLFLVKTGPKMSRNK